MTLMSYGQLTGTFAKHNNKYDDGEANYKLPLFNFIDIGIYNEIFWLRNISSYYLYGYFIKNNNIANDLSTSSSGNIGIHPLIMIR